MVSELAGQLKRRVLLLIILIVGMVGAIIASVWMLLAIIYMPFGDRAWNIAQALDRLGNATTGGDGREMISERASRLLKEQRGWACCLCKFLDWLDTGHCKKSVTL